MNKGSIIIQEDFAENDTLKKQNEGMVAHWAPRQVTVFTGVVFYRSNDELHRCCGKNALVIRSSVQ